MRALACVGAAPFDDQQQQQQRPSLPAFECPIAPLHSSGGIRCRTRFNPPRIVSACVLLRALSLNLFTACCCRCVTVAPVASISRVRGQIVVYLVVACFGEMGSGL